MQVPAGRVPHLSGRACLVEKCFAAEYVQKLTQRWKGSFDPAKGERIVAAANGRHPGTGSCSAAAELGAVRAAAPACRRPGSSDTRAARGRRYAAAAS